MTTRSGTFATSYASEKMLTRTRIDKLRYLVLIVLLVALPSFVGDYTMFLINQILINIVAIMGLNLLTGYTGQLSIGNAAFFGIGSFATGGLMAQAGLPFWIAGIFAALFSMGIGLLIGIPSLRLRGLYLVLATLALHFIASFAMLKYQIAYFGPVGLNVPRVTVFGTTIRTDHQFYWIFMPVAFFSVWFVVNLLRTRMGRAYIAIRDNSIAAAGLGINVAQGKLSAFAVSSFLVGLAGALNAVHLSNITVEQFTLHLAIDHLAMMLVGGMGSVLGAIFGTVFMTLLPYLIPSVASSLKSVLPFIGSWLQAHIFEVRSFLSGLAVVLALLLKPEGLYGFWVDLRNYVKEWPYRY